MLSHLSFNKDLSHQIYRFIFCWKYIYDVQWNGKYALLLHMNERTRCNITYLIQIMYKFCPLNVHYSYWVQYWNLLTKTGMFVEAYESSLNADVALTRGRVCWVGKLLNRFTSYSLSPLAAAQRSMHNNDAGYHNPFHSNITYNNLHALCVYKSPSSSTYDQ